VTKSHRLLKAGLEYFTGARVFKPQGNSGYCGVTGDTCWWLQPEPQFGERKNQAGKNPGKS